MKYRIVMNGNGKFKIERAKGTWFPLWYPLGQFKSEEPWFGDHDDYILLFDSSEAACKALLEAQERDARDRREEQWSVVATDEPR